MRARKDSPVSFQPCVYDQGGICPNCGPESKSRGFMSALGIRAAVVGRLTEWSWVLEIELDEDMGSGVNFAITLCVAYHYWKNTISIRLNELANAMSCKYRKAGIRAGWSTGEPCEPRLATTSACPPTSNLRTLIASKLSANLRYTTEQSPSAIVSEPLTDRSPACTAR